MSCVVLSTVAHASLQSTFVRSHPSALLFNWNSLIAFNLLVCREPGMADRASKQESGSQNSQHSLDFLGCASEILPPWNLAGFCNPYATTKPWDPRTPATLKYGCGTDGVVGGSRASRRQNPKTFKGEFELVPGYAGPTSNRRAPRSYR